MKTSANITNIASSLLKAQKSMGAASKGSVNPYFKSKYADLSSVLEACKDALNDNGITILQPHCGDVLETLLLHESGEWVSSETKIVCSKLNDAQAQGSAISYARRYGLQSLLSIPAADDDSESTMDRKTVSNVAKLTTITTPVEVTTKVEQTTGTFNKTKSTFNKPPKPVTAATPVVTSSEEGLG